MSDVTLDNVCKAYGDHVAVNGIDLKVAAGEFLTLLGPSGCGKTTCLRMIAGFIKPTSGRILIGGRDVTHLPPHRRHTGMVFQSYALFPHLTVAGNVAFGLEVRGLPRPERDRRTREALQLVRLEQFADRYPAQLSGGERQRVALARAVVINPEILLLDEPLAALDLKLREELQVEIKRVQSTLNMTTVFVTHDQGEALSMSTRVAVMRQGSIVQVGTPDEIYERPNSRYVANFVGRINLMDVTVEAKESDHRHRVRSATTSEGPMHFSVTGPQPASFEVGDRCLLAVRPEHLQFGADGQNRLDVTVNAVTYRGSFWHVEALGRGFGSITILGRPGEAIPARGATASIRWAPEHCFLLKPD